VGHIRQRCFEALGAAVMSAALACAGARAAADSDDSAQAKAKLNMVRARIAALTKHVGDELKQRDGLSAHLRETELVITAQRRRLDALRAEQAAVERRRAELRAEQSRERTALQAERAALAAQVQAAYMIGRQEQLKLLLNQGNPAGLGRTLTYYEYFARERSGKIDVIQAQVARLLELVTEIETQSAQLKTLEAAAAHEMESLEHSRADRADALKALTRQVASGNQELGRLRHEEQVVEALVADLSRLMQDFPTDSTLSFASMRGKLPWPVQGRVTARYQEQLTKNGEMIEAARGTKVRAPYFGRVVYADWLQGLGLLLIIGHSGGYMTLYGHAEVLYKSVGDWVAPGDVIAAMSDAAGTDPQLYFEIREGRKTVDPAAWLTPRP
jgi:septal ring factor EnvC (AmiA/AmiB activator)